MIDTLKKKVYKILRDYPKSRDSDKWLMCKFWTVYYPSRIKRFDSNNKECKPYVFLEDILDFENGDNISRVRQIIQNQDGEFLPNSESVRKQRKINEQKWYEYCSKLKTI